MSTQKKPREEVARDIQEHPNRHQHDFAGLTACCTIDGVVDTGLIEAHSRVSGRSNGGVPCDVVGGPCACGAWH